MKSCLSAVAMQASLVPGCYDADRYARSLTASLDPAQENPFERLMGFEPTTVCMASSAKETTATTKDETPPVDTGFDPSGAWMACRCGAAARASGVTTRSRTETLPTAPRRPASGAGTKTGHLSRPRGVQNPMDPTDR